MVEYKYKKKITARKVDAFRNKLPSLHYVRWSGGHLTPLAEQKRIDARLEELATGGRIGRMRRVGRWMK